VKEDWIGEFPDRVIEKALEKLLEDSIAMKARHRERKKNAASDRGGGETKRGH